MTNPDDKKKYLDKSSPAPLGEWIKTMQYNAASQADEVVYRWIVGINTDGQASLDAYNEGRHFWMLTQPEEDFIKYFEVEYEIKYPEDYTAKETCIRPSDLSLWAENAKGVGFDKDGVSYIGLGQCFDVTSDVMENSEEKIMPGDTVTGKAVFTMMADNPEFVFRLSFKDTDGEFIASSIIRRGCCFIRLCVDLTAVILDLHSDIKQP